MTMKMSNLPGELVEEILTRVPLKTMRAVRLTCRKWNALSKTRSFRKMHLDREEAAARELGESRIIMMKDYNVYLMNIVVNENPSKEVEGKLTCLNNSEQIKISQVFLCDGLLLCILKNDDTKVVVWNPYLGQTRWIQTRDSYRGWCTYRSAIGYQKKKSNSCPNHKILRCIDENHFSYSRSQYEIYNFDSKLWKTLDVTPHGTTPFSHSVSLKGNTYWCVVERKTYVDHILSFDFTKERFGPLLPLPFHKYIDDYYAVILSCVREEKLAALCDKFYKIEIWITTKIEAKKISWCEFLTVDVVGAPRLWASGGSFFIDEEKKVTMVLNKKRFDTVSIFGESGYLRELDLGLGESVDKTCRPRLCSYVPSLVQINEQYTGGDKRRKRD